MRIWLTKIGEPLPFEAGARLLRCGLIAQAFADRGHDVTWWTSTFDHIARMQRSPTDHMVVVAPNYRIQLLHAPAYRANRSLARLRHHHHIAQAFARRARTEPTPDLLYCSVPTLEVTEAAVRYAAARTLPTVVDIRDLWPDVFLSAVPRMLRPVARIFLTREFRRAARILRHATGIVAISDGYLRWGLARATRPRGMWDAVFPHGYPSEQFGPDELAQARRQLEALGVDPRHLVCSFVGTFGPWCDLAPAITTARRMREAGDDRVQFVFAGEGERGREWRMLAEGLDNVVFTGWLPSAGIAALLRMSSVGLAAYVDGALMGLPNKIFEFLSAGLPILSSLRGEAEALLAETGCGLTYSARDPNTFASALGSLLTDPGARPEMGRRALAKFEAEFRADVVYPALVRHLEELVRASR